ncbi:hypothetical protein WCLP8_4860003 [uncultured Gammaproteobacteria bacterium]
MLTGGRWVATAEGDGRTAGFHISTLYSPFETWGEIAIEHGQVYKDPPRLQVWTNNKLGETWEDQAGESVEPDSLMARREHWGLLLPAGVAALTAGVDLQGDRIELQVIGWGRDEECWVVDYKVIWGDPSGPRVWADLDSVLYATYAHSRAVPDLSIRAVAVDTGGHHTKAAPEVFWLVLPDAPCPPYLGDQGPGWSRHSGVAASSHPFQQGKNPAVHRRRRCGQGRPVRPPQTDRARAGHHPLRFGSGRRLLPATHRREGGDPLRARPSDPDVAT